MSHQNQSWHVSDEELAPVVEMILRESGVETLTVDDVLFETKKGCREFRILAVQYLRKQKDDAATVQKAEEDRKQKELDQKTVDEVARASALLREKLGLKPVTSEELEQKFGKGATNSKVAANIFQPSQIPEAVTALREKFGQMLPSNVFQTDRWAVTFRGWMAFWNKRRLRELGRNGLSPEYRQGFEDLGLKMKVIFDAATEMVVAWGLELTFKTSLEEFNELRGQLEVKGSKFYWLTQPPLVETAEEKVARETAEAEASAELEARQKALNDLKDSLKAHLKEANPEMSEENADLLATKVAKHALKKYDELPEIKTIFAKAAIHRMYTAKQPLEVDTAKSYARAADMTDEELEVAVNALREQQAAKSKPADGDEDTTPKTPKVYGEMSNAAIENAQKKRKQKGNNGQQKQK